MSLRVDRYQPPNQLFVTCKVDDSGWRKLLVRLELGNRFFECLGVTQLLWAVSEVARTLKTRAKQGSLLGRGCCLKPLEELALKLWAGLVELNALPIGQLHPFTDQLNRAKLNQGAQGNTSALAVIAA